MKSIIAILTFLVSVQALAIQPIFPLEKGDGALFPMEGITTVYHQSPKCPAGAACMPVTLLNVEYRLFGCMDRKISVNKVVHSEDGMIDVYISAFNVQNEKSLVTMCIAMPVVNDTIMLGTGFIGEESVRVHFLGVPENGME